MGNRQTMAKRVSALIATALIAVSPSACAGNEREVLDRDAMSLVSELREVDGVLDASAFVLETNLAPAKLELLLSNDLDRDEITATVLAARTIIVDSAKYGEKFGDNSSLEISYYDTIDAPRGEWLRWGDTPSESTIEADIRVWQEFTEAADTVYLYFSNAGGFRISVYPAVDENGDVLTEDELRELFLRPWLAAGNSADDLEVKVTGL